MAILNPSAIISGALPVPSSGALNVYPDGFKVNSAPAGSPAYEYWQDKDGNVIGQAIIDVVNSGTVILFASASTISGILGAVSSSHVAVSSAFYPLSSSYYPLSSTFWLLSASLSSSASGVLTAPLYFSSSASFNKRINDLVIALPDSRVTALEQQVNGNGTPSDIGISGTIFGAYTSPGISATLMDLSAAFYQSDIPGNEIASGALVQVAMMFLGTRDLVSVQSGTGGATGSHPTASYGNLRESFYTLTASFNTMSGAYAAVTNSYAALSNTLNSSASIWNGVSSSLETVSGNFYTLSGNLNNSASIWNSNTTGALSTSFHNLSGNLNSSASIWNANTTGALSTSFYTLSGNLDSSASIWNANTTGGLSTSFYTLSGNLDSSASVWNANTTGALSTSFYTLSGNLDSSASVWNANTTGALSTSFYTLSGNLDSSASIWNANTTGALSTSFYTLSGNLDTSASHWNNTSSSLSGVINSSSLSPTAIYLRSPNGTTYRLDVDNAGVITTTAV